MGVPKFFRYTSERYPCLNELVKQYQIPEFDNMYLDMNGIIHNCSHPDDSNPHFRITEEKIFQDIFHYISILFQIIKPKKLFFMAIDGVAPRAKMNQQRGRRFRSAREAENLEAAARAKGETLPAEKRFDSNCITPGTVFMARLHEQLRFFVKQKISTDPLWSQVKVILSGHETPGEGEHKIMDYIRWSRSQPNYDPNTRHCLYGLDADLIMLGMCTHEPHFALLREEVKFGKTTQRATSPEETNFYLLHLSLLREYLEQEFISIKDSLPFEYDLEKVVDDWVLMGFLVGNDFIPHLPHMHIGNDALPLLYSTYMKVLPTLDGYINEAGDLNLPRFEVFMQELAKIDKEKFQDVYADLKYFEAKTGRRPNAQERKEYKPNNDETFGVDVEDIKNNKPDDELQALINATQEMFMDDVDNDLEEYEETSDEEANMEMEFILHKKDYYMNKLDYSKVTEEVLADQAEGYVRAIQWNLFYYYKGCPSWCWYYPHHYAPYISDIKGFKDLKIEFELGEPFKPFEQLLAVLPAASKHLLPAPFHDLMTDEDSPIVHYYPVHFETDLNGKRNDWEAVVLIPFIDETNLLSAMAPCYQRLTDDELRRNTHGPMLEFTWSPASLGVEQAPEYFPPINECHAVEKRVFRNELDVPPDQLKRGMLPNALKDMIFPGFPTMKHLKYTTSLKKSKVKVFDQPSRNESMIVKVTKEPDMDETLDKVAQELLGKVIWVGWPHLTRSKVMSVSNEKMRLHYVDNENNNVDGVASYTTEANNGNLLKQWVSERSTIIEHNMNRLGIDLDGVNVIVHAVNLKGYKYTVHDNVEMVRTPEWCSVACGYALQAVVKDVSARVMPDLRHCGPGEAFPVGGRVFLLTRGQYYGSLATVVDSESVRNGRVKVSVVDRPEPLPSTHVMGNPYRNAHHAATSCGISTPMLSRITGSVLVVSGERNDLPTEQLNKINVGLNLKFNKKNQEVSGYTRRCKVTNAWQYSERCVELVRSYTTKFPELFDRLAVNLNNDIFFESDLWPNEVGQKKPNEVAAWLKTQPHVTAVRRECGSEAMEPEEMKALWDDVKGQLDQLKDKEKKVTLQVKWSLLYRPELNEGSVVPDPKADYRLRDRVVCSSGSITAPLGSCGTVTAVYPPPPTNTVRLSDKLNADCTYQVMFDEPFVGAVGENLFDENRFYRMLPTNMLNISYGRGIRNNAARSPAAPASLRRDLGHHSAFASYSPPIDQHKAQSNNVKQTNNVVNNGSHDNATHLLRSLLKISEDDDSSKKNKNKNANESNWRRKNDNSPGTAAAQQHRILQQQQGVWRKENKQQPQNVYTNSSYKNQPPMPPFPSFNQPFPGPGPTQIPFPQFQNQQFPHNAAFGYGNEQRGPRSHRPAPNGPNIHGPGPNGPSVHGPGPNGPSVHGPGPSGPSVHGPGPSSHGQGPNGPKGFGSGPQQALGFPKHLPAVTGNNISLGPSWIYSQPKPGSTSTSNAGKQNAQSNDKVNNPFVPLQVQTSQRRIQNSSSSSSSKRQEIQALKALHPQPEQADQVVQQPKENKSRPQKKKKPRIAANLPFQME